MRRKRLFCQPSDYKKCLYYFHYNILLARSHDNSSNSNSLLLKPPSSTKFMIPWWSQEISPYFFTKFIFWNLISIQLIFLKNYSPIYKRITYFQTFLKFTKDLMRKQITIITSILYSEWSNSVLRTVSFVISQIEPAILSSRNVLSTLLLFFPTIRISYTF